MKIAGYILVATALLNLLIGIVSLNDPVTTKYGTNRIAGFFMFGVLGAYCLYRASEKKKEKEDQDRWMENLKSNCSYSLS